MPVEPHNSPRHRRRTLSTHGVISVKVTSERLPRSLMKLTVEMDEATVEKELDRAARSLSQQVSRAPAPAEYRVRFSSVSMGVRRSWKKLLKGLSMRAFVRRLPPNKEGIGASWSSQP
jgi:hypothetical protein